MDRERAARTVAGMLIAVLEDSVDGEANNWPAILKALDELYQGNFLTERIADYAVGHMKDAYAAGIQKAHARLVAMRLEGIS